MRTIFINSLYPLTNFITTCEDEQLVQIRNNDVIEIFANALNDHQIIITLPNGKAVILEILECYSRLFDFNWKPWFSSMDSVGLTHVFQ